jgi:hypothetical protein
VRYVAALVVAPAVAGTALAFNDSIDSPKAFDRPARATDALPAALRTMPPGKFGFYDYRAYSGCPCAVSWLDAYAGVRRVHHQSFLAASSRKRR